MPCAICAASDALTYYSKSSVFFLIHFVHTSLNLPPIFTFSACLFLLFLCFISFLLFPCASVGDNTRAWVPHYLLPYWMEHTLFARRNLDRFCKHSAVKLNFKLTLWFLRSTSASTAGRSRSSVSTAARGSATPARTAATWAQRNAR